jgi:hypothetical protein
MELDAADWLNIMILHIGSSVNRASKKDRCEPDRPGSGLDWPARPDQSRSCATERVTVRGAGEEIGSSRPDSRAKPQYFLPDGE